MSKWIPCKERLPEKEGYYIVSLVAYNGRPFADADDYFIDGWNTFGGRVVAWMPFPEPYKEDKDNGS